MSYFKLHKPTKGTAAHADAARQAFAEVRGAIERRAVTADEQAKLMRDCPIDELATLRAGHLLGRRSRVSAGAAVERHVWDTLGMQGYARMLLGRLYLSDLHKLAPSPAVDGKSTMTQSFLESQMDRAYSLPEAATQAARQLAALMDGITRDHAEARADRESENADGVSLTAQRYNGPFATKPMEASPEALAALRQFADALAARDVTRKAHDDQGASILSAALPMWTAGAYLTPLAEQVPAPAKLAVSLLVDVSGSTKSMNRQLWAAVGALWHALVEAGHAVAVDVWGKDLICPSEPFRPWGAAPRWEVPVTGCLSGATYMKESALPALGRMQASAPHGLRQVCIVITDGDTCAHDRAEFLRLASTPCLYWMVEHAHNATPIEVPSPLEGWAAIGQTSPQGVLASMTGEAMLEALLTA